MLLTWSIVEPRPSPSPSPQLWVSMGEPIESWGERVSACLPFQVNAGLLAATGNPRVKVLHCLPAFHNSETKVGAQVAAEYAELADGDRDHRGGLRVGRQPLLRAGGEPDAHDQGAPGGVAGMRKEGQQS
jgi:Aspartate/ornithine carbamoyltransferase, Asp/Orn binding domain